MSILLRTCENSPTNVKKQKNANVVITKVLETFRFHFCAQASNRKANRRSNRRSLAVAAAKRGVRHHLGGANDHFSEKESPFENPCGFA